MLRRPYLTVAFAAVAARAVAVLAIGPLQSGYAQPDEQQYMELAASVARGDGAEAWFPGYGQSLYDTTRAFMAPLTVLVRIFGQHQLVGQCLAAVYGVAAAMLTLAVARRALRTGPAVAAGLVAALLPSQVFWSSVVLRESLVWLALAALALSVALAARWRHPAALFGAAAGAGGALLALCYLRPHTAVVAAWALLLAGLLLGARRRFAVPAAAVLLAIVVPYAGSLGPLGLDLAAQAVPQLARIRTGLSLDASSSFVEAKPIPKPTQNAGGPVTPGTAAPTEPGATPPPTTAEASDVPTVKGKDGTTYAVEDSTGSSVSALPTGLVAVLLRPWPWDATTSNAVAVAKAENAVWLTLYVLAATGVASAWRLRHVLAFPTVLVAGLALSSALTQGNLGTAFRHRGQMLWALAVLAAAGVQHLMERRRGRSL